MNPRATDSLLPSCADLCTCCVVVLIFGPAVTSLHGQDSSATLSGTVTDSSGKAVLNAKVTVKNTAKGQSPETQNDSAGLYTVPILAAGDYEVSASAAGIGAATAKATLTIGSSQNRALARRPRLLQDRDPGQRGAAGLARQAHSHAEDAPALRTDRHRRSAGHLDHFRQRRRHEHDRPQCASCAGRGYHRLVCDPHSENRRHPNPGPNQAA
jgi:hypothetical protein